jgi:hypothetical protein
VLTAEENRQFGQGRPVTVVIKFFEGAHVSGDPATIQKTVKNMMPAIKHELKRTIG